MLALILAIIHQRDQPVRHIVDVRHNGSAGRDARDVFVIRNFVEFERIALLCEARAMLGLLQHIGDAVTGGMHVQRIQNPVAHELFPGLSGLQLDHITDRRIHQVVVEERGAHGLLWLQILQPVEQLLARKIGFIPDGVVPGDSGTV